MMLLKITRLEVGFRMNVHFKKSTFGWRSQEKDSDDFL